MSRLSVLLLMSLLVSGKSAIRGPWSEPFYGDEQQQYITSPQRGLQVDACESLADAFEDGAVPAPGFPSNRECSCIDEASGGSLLECDNVCDFCDATQTTCFSFDLDLKLDENGIVTDWEYFWSYTAGLTGTTVLVEYTGCQNDDCSECRAVVNGVTECESCELKECSDGEERPAVSCEAFEAGAIYDLCEENLSIATDSPFYFWSDIEGPNCFIDGTELFIPTDAPAASPAPISIDSSQCTLRIATYRCDAVVATSQIGPIDGCDCYNFCGDTYDGCCAAGEACGIEDCETDSVPVAGCRLDGVIDTNPEPVCVVTFANGTANQLFEGQSFGDLVSNACGPPDEYPCECRTLSEDDNVRCPYCNFLNQDQDTVCARDGESITFIDSNGITQKCSCDYLGNDQGAVFCESVPDQPACTRHGDVCGSATECCSGRCFFGSCQTPARTTDPRLKLGAGLGGAGGRAKNGGVGRRIKEGAKIRGE